jgi:carboxypeptidase C (cathepsin A)
LATPFFGTEYSLNHLGLEPSVHGRVTFGYYPSGHMIYLNDPSRASLRADLVRFYQNAVR